LRQSSPRMAEALRPGLIWARPSWSQFVAMCQEGRPEGTPPAAQNNLTRHMGSAGAEAVRRYHEATKHSYRSVRRSVGGLDWSNEPFLFKVYPDLAAIPLPRHVPRSGVPAAEAVATSDGDRNPDLGTLASLLLYSAGVLRRSRTRWGEVAFRAASCTGALYHLEVYLVCGELPGLPAGVYHFDPRGFALRPLRTGDFRHVLVDAAVGEESVARAVVTVVLTSMWQRNAWKYQARAWRHVFWDAGTVLANLLALASAHRVPSRVVLGFVDREVVGLLDLDPAQELPVALVPLGRKDTPPPPSPPVSPLGHRVLPVLRREIREPLVLEAHEASSFRTADEVRAWRTGRVDLQPKPSGPLVPLRPLRPEALPTVPLEQVIERRRSTRRFGLNPIPFEAFSEVLMRCSADVPTDFANPLVIPHGIVHAVEGLTPGAYVYHLQHRAVELLRGGDFRQDAAFAALEQAAAGLAAADVAFLTDLRRVLEVLGPRGYRAAQLEGGIRGGRVYLLAHALGLRATALTFYDDEVTRLFSPHAKGRSPMFLTVFGWKG